MSNNKTVTHGVGCSLPLMLIITIVLLALKYTVAPTLPLWLALLPVIIWAVAISLFIGGICLFVGGAFLIGIIATLMRK